MHKWHLLTVALTLGVVAIATRVNIPLVTPVVNGISNQSGS